MFNKDLDRLFQEKFKDFEEIPNNNVWRNISKQINTKKRFSYLKLRLVGIAAMLLLFISIWYYNSDFSNNLPSKIENTITKNKYQNNQTEIVDNNDNEVPANKEEVKLNNERYKLNITLNKVKNSNGRNELTKSDNLTYNVSKISIQNNKKGSHKLAKIKKKNNSQSDKTIQLYRLKKSVLAINNKDTYQLKSKPICIKQITNKLALVDLSAFKLDIREVAKNSNVKEKIERWEVGSVIAPIYFASLTKGSPIDYRISENDQVNANSFSYGVDVAYQLNKKWSVKTGLKKQNLSYITKDVGLEFKLESYSGNSPSANISFERGDFVLSSVKGNSQDNVTFIGDIQQELNYIELPVEFKYNLSNNKIGIDLNGGFSTLFLNKNKIIFKRADKNFKLGEASNINKTDYTMNLGFDTNIKISKSLKYSISPSFKYHLNTFSKNDGGFKPYSIGINTGLYYKF